MDVHASPAELPELEVDDLAQHFHTPRAAVLCHVMHWGLSREQTGPLDQGDSQGPVRHLYLYVESELHERVEKAAIAAGALPKKGVLPKKAITCPKSQSVAIGGSDSF
jgi:hypothetical protein